MSEGANAGEATAAVAEGEAISENYVDAEGKAHLSSEFSDLNEEYSGLKEGQSPKGKVGFTDESTGTTYVSETYNHDKLVEDEEKSLDPAGVGLNLDKFSPGERVNTEETERIYKDIFDISPEVASETAKTFKKNQEGEPNIRPTADSEDLGASKNPDRDKSLKTYRSDTTIEDVPANRKDRVRPTIPSPLMTFPSPVSQADKTTRSEFNLRSKISEA